MQNQKLKINDTVSIDLSRLIESRLLIQANSGGGKLDGPKRRVLKPLLEAYPNDMSAEDLCQAAGYQHPLSKGFTVPRGTLRTFGLVEYPSPGRVKASSILFL